MNCLILLAIEQKSEGKYCGDVLAVLLKEMSKAMFVNRRQYFYYNNQLYFQKNRQTDF